MCRLLVEHLVDQVVHDEPVVPGERGDERRRVVVAVQRQGSELQCSGPALGPRLQRLHVGGREPEVVDGVEVGLGLLGGEAEVAGAYLDQLTAGP